MPIQYDSNGIITQNLTEILDERENALKPIMGEDFVIDKTTPIGNMELADANSELAIQELIAWLLPNMIDANTATGYFLDCICEKNKIYRKQPEYTKLHLVINGTPNTSFEIGDITVSESFTDIYYNLNEACIIGDTGIAIAEFICQIYGDNYPVLGSKFEILTPMVGLDSVEIDFEQANIVIGRNAETDEELRRRRTMSVQQTSTNTLESIASNLYSLDGVLHTKYFENDTESTNEDGLPMKSFEIVVDGGDENKIAEVIYNNKPVGTRAYGTTIIEERDSEGVVHNIGFTKAEVVNIGINIKLNTTTPQGESWKNDVFTDLKKQFDNIQDIGSIVKDYNYYTVLTQYPEISDIYSIEFFDTEEEGEIHYYSQYIVDKKQIAKLDKKDIHITIGRV